ncbi:response regulator [Geobacter sp. SVR]|uniref:response regulator n=1 Tax=Geobacter sp. SVR TaxID=2495594 RepID=UPI00143EF738|nr:response regulator [Geobacter sp. SVR]BCS55495.1 response regulator [Geobacter sp. SVR]GCF83498.1 response regulator [Geobacter sp. SVR]
MKKALIIEDNRDSIRLMIYALKRAEYEVIAAETGEEGVHLALAEHPDVVIIDINLPGIDGLEAARRVRKASAGAGLPIIAITAYAMAGDMERILSAGCNGYFEKPIDPLTIVEKIEAVIKGA